MKIIICGSLSATSEILSAQNFLEGQGYEVEIPEGVKHPQLRSGPETSQSEEANVKIENDLIRGYFEKIKNSDVVLVVNPEKKGVPGYIGGNTLIEMAFAHVLGKKLYCLFALPDLPYSSEILALQPEVLNGDLQVLSDEDEDDEHVAGKENTSETQDEYGDQAEGMDEIGDDEADEDGDED